MKAEMNKKELKERIKNLKHVIHVHKKENIEVSPDIYNRIEHYQIELLKTEQDMKKKGTLKQNPQKPTLQGR